MNPSIQKHVRTLLTGLIIATTIVIVYVPGLHGPWVFDDITNIVRNTAIQINTVGYDGLWRAAFSDYGTLPLRPLSQLTVALNHYFGHGLADTFPFKATNLAIHLINTMLVYWLAALVLNLAARRQPLRTPSTPVWLPALVALAWAVHPLHLTPVLYVVQRMTSLSALFVLLGLIAFIHGRERLEQRRRYGLTLMGGGVLLGTVLGFLCKENAVLLVPLALIVDQLFYGGTPDPDQAQRNLARLYLGLVAAAVVAALFLLTRHPNVIDISYANREFTLGQRLLTEPRILLLYLSLAILPLPHRFTLFHDDIPLSTGLLEPWTTPPALAVVFGAIVVAIVVRRRYPLFSFAILWYAVGHSLESSVLGLELAHEHRNYLPDVGLFIGVIYGLFLLLQRVHHVVRHAALAGLILSLGVVTHARAHLWASDETIIASMARDHPLSARSQAMLATLYVQRKGDPDKAIAHYSRAALLAPHDTSHVMNLAIAGAATLRSGECQNTNADSSEHDPIARLQSLLGRSPVVTADLLPYITDRLANSLLTTTTLDRLGDLAICSATATQQCEISYCVFKDWVLAALQNPNMPLRQKENFTIHLFSNAADHGDYMTALAAAQLGLALDPSKPSYRLMEVNAHILLGDTRRAATLLNELRATPNGLDDEASRHIEALEQAIQKRQQSRDVKHSYSIKR
jgi:hypothetical protein